jgi:hypothetical protein
MSMTAETPAPSAWHSIVQGEVDSLTRQIHALFHQDSPWVSFTAQIGGQEVRHSMRVQDMIEHLEGVRDTYLDALDHPPG